MKCKICGKPIKEDTWRNNKYCQGHGIFEETKITTEGVKCHRQK
jgi:hypothetical protein